jgi:PAS domain S-box-containing protein
MGSRDDVHDPIDGLSEQDESALRMSDAIISISADAIISIDEDQRIIRFNHGAEQIFGYTPDQVIGREIDMLIPDRFRKLHSTHVRNFREGAVEARRMGERRQISGLRKNGQEFPAEASISRTRLDGRMIFTVVLRDVTERIRTEQAQRFLAQAGALLASSLDLNTTLESVAGLALPTLGDWCVIYLVAGDQSVQLAFTAHTDGAMADELRRLRARAVQLNPSDPLARALKSGDAIVVHDLDRETLSRMANADAQHDLLRSLDPGSLLAVPLKARDRIFGALAFFFEKSARLHDEDDLELAQELARRAALALDNARLYERAQAAHAARDDVLAVVSHDLGNPLAAIRIGASVLAKQLPQGENNERLSKQIENIRTSALQMERLLRDLLQVKQIEAGYLTLEKERLSVRSLLSEAIDQLRPLADAKEQTISMSADAAAGYINADRERLLQVLSNLVGNAVKFTPAGGEISLRAHRENDSIIISVSDSGPGIPQEHLPHVFDRFYRVDPSRSRVQGGSGIGLAIARSLVTAQGGSIEVESAGPNQGSRFSFTLPIAR